MNTRHRLAVFLIFSGTFCATAHSNDATTRPSAASGSTKVSDKPKVRSEAEVLADELASPDVAIQQKSLNRIKELLATPSDQSIGTLPWKVNNAFDGWIKSLLKVHRYDDVEGIALEGIRRRAHDVAAVSGFQKARAQALLAAGKNDDALAAAKGYYNVCSLKESSAAIDLISICLANARPDEKGIVRQFKSQQMAGAATQPSTQPTGGQKNILSSIAIDGKPFEAAIQAIKFRDFDKLLAKGNLLLLSDHAKEAQVCFEAASEIAHGQRQVSCITESIARAIRAETGAIGPANAFILSQQGN